MEELENAADDVMQITTKKRRFRKKEIEIWVKFCKETREVIAQKIQLDRQVGGHYKKKKFFFLNTQKFQWSVGSKGQILKDMGWMDGE